MSDRPLERHLGLEEVAAYVDGTEANDARAQIQAHLAACAECRSEVAEVSGLARALPHAQGSRRRGWLPAAVAAAVLLLVARSWTPNGPAAPSHREAAVTATVAPRPVAPVGMVDSATTLTWSSVPSADRYHVRLFDADGTVVWEREGTDTVAALPTSLVLRSQLSYYWKVEAHTGVDRWAASDLVEFVVGRGGRR